MVTNYPQQLAASAEVTPQESHEPGIVNRFATRIGQVLCGLHGHDAVLHFERNRVMMRCTSCGHDTPGWEISGQGPRKRFEGDAHRHLIKKPRLVLRRTA
ncbi:MAG TPA: hypothetical protein VH740_05750 [Vicinamibacterales bacterium]|jgi:hypothetical protein